MGWHKRHASVSDRGSRGILRPETLNLEAWISCSGIFFGEGKKIIKQHDKILTKNTVLHFCLFVILVAAA